MGLFFYQDEHQYTQRGTSTWENLGSVQKQPQIRSVFFEKDPTGAVKSIDLCCDDEHMFYYASNGIRALELNLTVMQQQCYYINQRRAYEIKLKRKNLLTIIFTLNFQTFVAFYKHLAKYTILTSFEKHFKVQEEIGKGAFSKVYNGINIISKQTVALKVFDKKFISSLSYGTAIINNEIMNLEMLRKFQLSPLIGVYEITDYVIIVMRKAQAGNMLNYLKLHAVDYDQEFVSNIIFKILKNLELLHSAGFIHRDIKPQNIFFHNSSSESALFLGDFGCSVMKKDCESSKIGKISSGTLGFIAPEVIITNFYDEKCDIFSLGSLFYYLLTGEPIFSQKQAHQIYELVCDDKIIERKINSIPNVNSKCKDLLSKLLKVNPQQRSSALEALNHKYFENKAFKMHTTGEQNLALATYAQQRVKKFFR